MNLVLEVNEKCVDKTTYIALDESQVCIMISPTTGEDYWIFRVKLCNDQAVVGFPKFGLVGVGMAVEENSNTNLPLHPDYTAKQNAERTARHIWSNRKYKSITKQMIIDAIILIDRGARHFGLVK